MIINADMTEQPAFAQIDYFIQSFSVAILITGLQGAHTGYEILMHFSVLFYKAVLCLFQHHFFVAEVFYGVVNQVLELLLDSFFIVSFSSILQFINVIN